MLFSSSRFSGLTRPFKKISRSGILIFYLNNKRAIETIFGEKRSSYLTIFPKWSFTGMLAIRNRLRDTAS